MTNSHSGLALLLCFLLGATACSSSSGDDETHMGPSRGPVATNAAEAWPDSPASVPVISAQKILEACSIAGACSDEVMQLDPSTRTALIDLCVFDAVFSAERAIPMSGFDPSNERTELWVDCVLSNAQSCDVVEACKTKRDSSIVCEEDGCRGPDHASVTCTGDVATISVPGRTFERDCSRAFAHCDASSSTGCSDRPFTQCPEGSSGVDRCEGNIRLGCDGLNQVSYHDCARLGGTCGQESDGGQGCVYPEPITAECATEDIAPASCEGSTLSACVNQRRLTLDSALCSAE